MAFCLPYCNMIRKEDLNKDFSNKVLEDALNKVIEDNSQENQNILIDAMLDTYLYTLVDMKSREKEENKDNINIILAEINEQKDSYIPLFTNEDELKRASEFSNFDIVLLSFEEVAALVLDQTSDIKGFVINVDSQNVIFNEELVSYIVKHQFKEKNQDPTKVTFKEGDEISVEFVEDGDYPTELVEALKEYFKRDNCVLSSYLRILNHNGQKSYLLITDFNGDKDEVFAKISIVARPYLDDIYLDQLDLKTKFGQEVVKGMQPFYKKKIFGIF